MLTVSILLLVSTLSPGLAAERPRLTREDPPGQRNRLSLGTLFVPQSLPATGKLPLFLHFHGPGWIAEMAAARNGLAVIHAQLGSGSAVYGKPFAEAARLRDLLAEAEKESGREFALVGLTGWSAGYGAIRAILRQQEYYDCVRWVVLMDGLHAGYTEERKPIERDLDCYLRLAEDAAAGRKRFLVTHSKIHPGKYASTTETAEALLKRVGARRTEGKFGRTGLSEESEVHRGGLRVLGCPGTTAADHVDHLHVLPALLALVQAPAASLRSLEPDRATGSAGAVVVEDVALVQTTQLIPPPKLAPQAQVEAVLEQLSQTLRLAKSTLDQAVRLHFYVASDEVAPLVYRALAKRFPGEAKPAVTLVTGAPVEAGVVVTLDAIAVSGIEGRPGTAKTVFPTGSSGKGQAPVAILPAGPVFHIAGQAERGKTLAEMTRKTLASLNATLRHLGGSRADVVQVKAFLHPMQKIAVVREEIAGYFGDLPVPPVTILEWTARDSIEIEMVAAARPASGKPVLEYVTPPGMTTSPIYSRVARIDRGKRIYTSGLLAEGKDGAAEVKAVFARLEGLLKAGGSDLKHLAKATYYVATDDASKQLNVLRPRYYDPKRPPSASKASVRGVGRKGHGLIVDMIAVEK